MSRASSLRTNKPKAASTISDGRGVGAGRGAGTAWRQHASRPIGGKAYLSLCVLLLLPGFALSRHIHLVDWRILFGVPLLASAVAFLAYRIDKHRSREGRWRIAESTLHLMDLAGGWPGAFLAQRRYRHKISKASFQLKFWTIVFAHNLIAIDALLGWRIASQLTSAFR